MAKLPNFTFHIKSVFDKPEDSDGFRVLVDRMMPPQLSAEEARVDLVLGDAAPSNKLRKWLRENPQEWDEFLWRYEREMDERGYAVTELFQKATSGVITLLYNDGDVQFNQAVALRAYLLGDI
ncbi:MAG: DUF488 family protein [Candidatus Promineifilaceae bacterium]